MSPQRSEVGKGIKPERSLASKAEEARRKTTALLAGIFEKSPDPLRVELRALVGFIIDNQCIHPILTESTSTVNVLLPYGLTYEHESSFTFGGKDFQNIYNLIKEPRQKKVIIEWGGKAGTKEYKSINIAGLHKSLETAKETGSGYTLIPPTTNKDLQTQGQNLWKLSDDEAVTLWNGLKNAAGIEE